MNYSIVGSGIAGISAAKAIRAHDADGDITVYTDEIQPLGLYARHEMARRMVTGIDHYNSLLIEGQESLRENGIHLEYGEVDHVFADSKEILVNYSLRRSFDRLLLAVGAIPRVVDIPGTHLNGVHQFRSYQDTRFIEIWMDQLRQMGTAIIGGGILALDLAHLLKARGVPTTLIVREVFLGKPFLAESGGRLLEKRLLDDGLNVIFNQSVTAFTSYDGKTLSRVQISNGRVVPVRMALFAIGVRPNTDFLQGSGVNLDESTGAVPVNELMQTNDDDIFAAGSCALYDGHIAHNWAYSQQQGWVAGANMAGVPQAYQPLVDGDLETSIYDLPLAYFGLTNIGHPATRVWLAHDDESYVQLLWLDGQIVGGTFLGPMTAEAPRLYDMYRDQVSIRYEELDFLMPR